MLFLLCMLRESYSKCFQVQEHQFSQLYYSMDLEGSDHLSQAFMKRGLSG